MAKTGTRLKSKEQQAVDAELGLIIDEMAKAMWAANRQYIAQSQAPLAITLHMDEVLQQFRVFCEEHPND